MMEVEELSSSLSAPPPLPPGASDSKAASLWLSVSSSQSARRKNKHKSNGTPNSTTGSILLPPMVGLVDPPVMTPADPLPPRLRHILTEVAKSGKCSTLTWHMPNTLCTTTHNTSPTTVSMSRASIAIGLTATRTHTHNDDHGSSSPSKGKTKTKTKHKSKRKKRSRHHPNPNANANGLQQQQHQQSLGPQQQHQQSTTTTTTTTATATRKRPRAATSDVSSPLLSSSSVPSGSEWYTSHGEDERSTHYECDSEGTSATTNSELSHNGRAAAHKKIPSHMWGSSGGSASGSSMSGRTNHNHNHERCYHTLQEVFREALVLVLDHAYRQCGGYRINPAERRKSRTLSELKKRKAVYAIRTPTPTATGIATATATATGIAPHPQPLMNAGTTDASLSSQHQQRNVMSISESAFLERRERLWRMLGEGGVIDPPPPPSTHIHAPFLTNDHPTQQTLHHSSKYIFLSHQQQQQQQQQQQDSPVGKLGPSHLTMGVDHNNRDAPPFTMQRVAEVLVSPDRYYAQTHKLCNGLEKLLLVTSPVTAFGGGTGGDSSQTILEEREMAALADERGREETLLRQRRLRRHLSSPSDGSDPVLQMNVDVNTFGTIKGTGSSEAGGTGSGDEEDRGTEDSDSTGIEQPIKATADTNEKTDFTPLDLEPRPFFSSSHNRDAQVQVQIQVHADNNANVGNHTLREELEGQARASLRNKFIHVGVDGGGSSHHHEQHHYSNSRGASPLTSSDHESAISHARGTASPPPPPGLALPVAASTFPHERSPLHHGDPELTMRHHIHESGATAGGGLGTTNPGAIGTGHTTSPDELRQLQGMNRAPSPLPFSTVDNNNNNNNNNNHVSGMPPSLVNNHHSPGRMDAGHHAAVRGVSPHTLGTSPAVQMEFFIHPATNSAVGSPPGVSHGPTSDANYLEERSSASNSDIDSESGDDVSLDDSAFSDSASDRSDGSDSGSLTGHYEPFTAARVMALNRMQQQQRREQFLQSRALAAIAANNDGYRPPADSDYQSGDSIDSMMAEDSCGSDSSNSDVAD